MCDIHPLILCVRVYVCVFLCAFVLVVEGARRCSHFQQICEVTVSAAYPSLTVLDALGGGEAIGLSKSQVWKLLSVDKLNRYLHKDPSPIELRYSISTRHR